MNTLNISEIFNNLPFYQQNYQSILAQPEQYKIIVEDASLHVWPLASKQLFLGDLLQLWFSEKWLINQACILPHQHAFTDLLGPLFQKDDLYLYQLQGNALLGKAIAKVWSVSEQKSIDVVLESSLQYYCTYKSVA